MRLWYFLASLSILLFSVPAFSSEPYFCDKPGTRLEYERHYVDSGKLKWRHLMEIGQSTYSQTANVLEYSSTFTKASGALMYGGPVELLAKTGDSYVELDLAASIASVFRNYVGSKALSYEPCLSRLSSQMKPGDVLEDARFELFVLGFRYSVAVTERLVLKQESIKTPAGEFDCMVVREHKVEKGPGRNRETTALTWYAKSVGMVRHDTYDKNGKLETSELLVSIKR